MDNKKIGSFISECRKGCGLTQQQLADRLFVSNKAISKWETGEGYPDISSMPQLCKVLSISTDDFFAGEISEGSEKVSYTLNDNATKSNGINKFHNNFNLFKAIGIGEIVGNMRQKIVALRPFLICAIIMYYILPMLFFFNEGVVVVLTLFLIPVACVICGSIYTVKYFFSATFAIGASILFLPAMLYINQTDHVKVTIILSVSYGIITLLASAIAIYIKNHFAFFVVKRETMGMAKSNKYYEN